MGKITEVLEKNLSLQADPKETELRARIQSSLASLEQTLTDLQRPKYCDVILFAEAWKKLDNQLSILEGAIREYSAKKPTNPIDEFLKTLQKKN